MTPGEPGHHNRASANLKSEIVNLAKRLSGNAQDTAGASKLRTVGRDAVATINGALTVGDGLNVQLNTATLDLKPGRYTVTLLVNGKREVGTKKVVVRAEADKADE